MNQRLLVISPVRNEADHFERVARSMAAQTRPPDTWVVSDDGSTDGTLELIERLAEEIPFMLARRTRAPEQTPSGMDRLAQGAAPRNFNAGLRSADWRSFTHIGKHDGDLELPPHYCEQLLQEFESDPALGIAGGLRVELERGRWRLERIPLDHHVYGAFKCYSRECFEAIGGVQERLGWDTIDETYARMHGFRTRSFGHLVCIHHRPWGSADGTLRGRARYGEAAYVLHYSLPWVTLRSLKMATARPRVVSGAVFLYGYLRAKVRRREQVEDDEFRAFIRRETRARLRAAVAPRRARSA